jgi:hypothetical protein
MVRIVRVADLGLKGWVPDDCGGIPIDRRPTVEEQRARVSAELSAARSSGKEEGVPPPFVSEPITEGYPVEDGSGQIK